MYYIIYSTENFMKKLSILFLLLAAGVPVCAQSTCETRVDSNLDKTTMQKVHYCLTPEAEPDPGPEPQVVYFSAYDSRAPRPVKRKIPLEIVQPGVVYHEEALSKNREYWEAKSYPLFTNDVLSSQDEQEVNCAVMELFPGSTLVPPPTATRIIMYPNGRDGSYKGPVTVLYNGQEIAVTDNGDGTFSVPGVEDASGAPLTGYFAYDPTHETNTRTAKPAYRPSVNLSTDKGNPYFSSKSK